MFIFSISIGFGRQAANLICGLVAKFAEQTAINHQLVDCFRFLRHGRTSNGWKMQNGVRWPPSLALIRVMPLSSLVCFLIHLPFLPFFFALSL